MAPPVETASNRPVWRGLQCKLSWFVLTLSRWRARALTAIPENHTVRRSRMSPWGRFSPLEAGQKLPFGARHLIALKPSVRFGSKAVEATWTGLRCH